MKPTKEKITKKGHRNQTVHKIFVVYGILESKKTRLENTMASEGARNLPNFAALCYTQTSTQTYLYSSQVDELFGGEPPLKFILFT